MHCLKTKILKSFFLENVLFEQFFKILKQFGYVLLLLKSVEEQFSSVTKFRYKDKKKRREK